MFPVRAGFKMVVLQYTEIGFLILVYQGLNQLVSAKDSVRHDWAGFGHIFPLSLALWLEHQRHFAHSSPRLVMMSSAVSLLWFHFNCIPRDIKQRVVQTSTVYMDQTAKTITKFFTGRQRWSNLSELRFVAEHLLPNAVGRVDDVLTGGILLGLKWHRTVSVPR